MIESSSRTADPDTSYNVLFFCIRNSARSIMAESLLNRWGEGRFRGFSAGIQPKGHIHPLALATLERHQLPTDGLFSKTWAEVAEVKAARLHFVFTVCEGAAQQQAPIWPGQPMTAHWSMDDPSLATGSLEERVHAFEKAFHTLDARIKLFTTLGVERDRADVQRDLDAIGLPA